MRKLLVLALVAVAATVVSSPAGAATKVLTYKGKATNAAKDFNYGKVIVKRQGSKVTYVEIQSVTSSCTTGSILRTLVYSAKSKDHKVTSGSNKIKGGKFAIKFLPVSDIEDDEITMSIKFSGSKATGSFSEEGLCNNEGVFSAKR
jgi:hypothetical protein